MPAVHKGCSRAETIAWIQTVFHLGDLPQKRAATVYAYLHLLLVLLGTLLVVVDVFSLMGGFFGYPGDFQAQT